MKTPTCVDCGKPMRLNVPRLGPQAGYVHVDTNGFSCGPQKPISIVLHHIDPNLPRFIIDNGHWVKYEPSKESTLPNQDYQPQTEQER